MLRVKGKTTVRRKLLAVYCLAALALPGCGPRRPASADIAAPMVKSNRGKAKNPYKAIKEKDFSKHIRAVFRTSAELREADGPASAQGSKSPPEDPEIQAAVIALEANPDDWETVRRLADLCLAAGRRLEAFHQYSRLQAAETGDAEVSRALALIWDYWGDYPKALEQAVQAIPATEIPARDWLFLGRIHLNGGNWDAATAALRQAAHLNPTDREALRLLGEAYAKIRDWETAANYLSRAVDQNPAARDTRRRLAEVLARQGKRQQALRQLLALGPAAAAHNELGEILLSERRWAEAYEAFAAALEADSNYRKARSNLAATLPYLPLPSSVTLPSFEPPTQSLHQALLGGFPAPINPLKRHASDYFAPLRKVDQRTPAPLIIEVPTARPSKLLAAQRPTPAMDIAPLAAVSVHSASLGPVEAVIDLPPKPSPSSPRAIIETAFVRVSHLIQFASHPAMTDAPQPLNLGPSGFSEVVQLPPWDLPTTAPSPAFKEEPEAFRDESEEARPAIRRNIGSEVAVSLDRVRPVATVDLASIPVDSPAITSTRGFFPESQSSRISALIAVGEVKMGVLDDTAAAVPFSAPPLVEISTVPALSETRVRPRGARPAAGYENLSQLSAPGWRDAVESLLENVVDLPTVPGTVEVSNPRPFEASVDRAPDVSRRDSWRVDGFAPIPSLRPSSSLQIRALDGVFPSPREWARSTEVRWFEPPQLDAELGFGRMEADRPTVMPAIAPAVRRSVTTAFPAAKPAGRQPLKGTLGALGLPVLGEYPRPFLIRGPHRFGNWSVEPRISAFGLPKSKTPAPGLVYVALMTALLGAALVFRRPAWIPSRAC